MTKAIQPSKRRLIISMLAQHVSIRDIALFCKVGRGTVSRVASDRKEPRQRQMAIQAHPVSAMQSLDVVRQRTVKPYKCRCGFEVTIRPCVICLARAGQARTEGLQER